MPAGRQVTVLLTGLVAVAVVLTLVGLVALWPDREALRTLRPVDPYQGVTFVGGSVVSISRESCPGTSEDRGPDGTVPAETDCSFAQVRLTEGESPAENDSSGSGDTGTGELRVPVPPEVERAGMRPGDRLRLARYPAEAGQPPVYAYLDYDRTVPLAVLAAVFAVLVVLVGRFKGLAAILGLAVVYPTIGFFMIPALRAGENPVLVAVTGSSAIMLVVLYLAHGVNAKTTIALLGTLVGLAVGSLVAWWASSAAHLDGLTSEDAFQLSRMTTGAGLSGIVLCGLIVASLGALNDVTITQASAVWEMRALAPDLPASRLFASGIRVGRDHLASTVYTIAFAYVGASLPLLLLLELYQQPFSHAITGGEIAEELVRTFVGSIALIITIPLTTAIAAAVVVRVAGPRPGRAVG